MTYYRPLALGICFENQSSNNFVQANTFSGVSSDAVRVDSGIENQLRLNEFNMDPNRAIMLLENGNKNLAVPAIQSADSATVSGTTCAGCFVEIYNVENNQAKYIGETTAGTDGSFQFQSCSPIQGNQVVALTIDSQGNTSAFSKPSSLAAAATSPDWCNATPALGNPLSTATPQVMATSTPAGMKTALPNTPADNANQPAGQLSKTEGTSSLPVILGIFGGVIVIGIVAMMVVRRKKQ